MLEQYIHQGNHLPWLPTYQQGQNQNNVLCQVGIQVGFPNTGLQGSYLPFALNGINWVAMNNLDVISYNFTGCIMAVYTSENVRRVCHISTGNGQDCLPAWRILRQNYVNVFEFRPSDYLQVNGKPFVGCYGLITNELRLYSITMIQNHGQQREVSHIAMVPPLRRYV